MTALTPEVEQRVREGIANDQSPASLTTVRAALADVLDRGESCAIYTGVDRQCDIRHSWEFDPNDESEDETENRELFINAIVRRIAELQVAPHHLDITLLAKLRDARAEYQRGYGDGWEDAMANRTEEQTLAQEGKR
jgi:hypothetical protein